MKTHPILVELSRSTRFSYEQLEQAAIEYGALFVDIFAAEAGRSGVDLMTIVRSTTIERKRKVTCALGRSMSLSGKLSD